MMKTKSVGQSAVSSLQGNTIILDLSSYNNSIPHLNFIFIVSGRYAYQGVMSEVNHDIQLMILFSDSTKSIELYDEWNILLIQLPTEAAEIWTSFPTQATSTFKNVSLLERAMFNFARTLLDDDGELSAVEIYAFEQLLLEMGGASILDRVGGNWRQGAPRQVMLNRAKAVIAQQCADPLLTPATVAFAVQSSLRQLQSIFSEAGTSIATEIRSRRVHAAYMLLQDARYDVLTIAQIAERSGFGTITSMRRAIIENYGISPAQVRRKRK